MDWSRSIIQARGAAAAFSMSTLHPSHFRMSVSQKMSHKSRFEKFINPFHDREKMDLRDSRLRPVIILAILLPRESLRNLRRISKTTNRAMSFMLPRLFRQVRIRYYMNPNQLLENIDGLQRIGSYCRELVISLHDSPIPVYSEPENLRARTNTGSTAHSSSRVSQESRSLGGSGATWDAIPQMVRRNASPAPSHTRDGTDLYIHPALRDASPSKRPLHSSEPLEKPSVWTQLLRLLPNLDALTIAIPSGDTTWHALTPIEKTLVGIRTALEKSCGDPSYHTISRLRALRLAPITPISIIPMRWAGLGALTTSNHLEWWNSFFWNSLTALELQISSPHIECSTNEVLMFRKILHHYLSSFKNTLKKLRFVWLGRVGPNPLLLDLEAQLNPERPGDRSNRNFSQPAIIWTELREVWLNAVPVGPSAAAVIAARATKLERIMTLDRKFWTDLEPGQLWDLDDPSGWRNILNESRVVGPNESEAVDEIERFGQMLARESEQHSIAHRKNDM